MLTDWQTVSEIEYTLQTEAKKKSIHITKKPEDQTLSVKISEIVLVKHNLFIHIRCVFLHIMMILLLTAFSWGGKDR